MVSTGAFKKFAVAVLKLACGIALATLIVTLVVWGVIASRDRSEEAANVPLDTLKTWPEITVTALGNTKFRLQTVWRNSNIYYQFYVQGYPAAFRQARERQQRPSAFSPLSPEPTLTITFLDKDGFKLFEHLLPFTEMVGVTGDDGQPTDGYWKGDELLNVDIYRRAARWELSWTGFSPAPALEPTTPSAPLRKPLSQIPRPVAPSPAATPKWRDVSLWRGLSHGMSKDDVKQIIGEPGKISDLGFLVIWNYGYPFGGSVTFGQDGTVQSWSEP